MRTAVRWLWIPVILAFAWSAWVVWSRRQETRALERAAEQRRLEAERHVLEKLGGDNLKILMFYANPQVLQRGSAGLLCYGVNNAVEVRIEPSAPDIAPSLNRCVEIRPDKTTSYTLKAKDAKGVEAEQTVEVRVR